MTLIIEETKATTRIVTPEESNDTKLPKSEIKAPYSLVPKNSSL